MRIIIYCSIYIYIYICINHHLLSPFKNKKKIIIIIINYMFGLTTKNIHLTKTDNIRNKRCCLFYSCLLVEICFINIILA